MTLIHKTPTEVMLIQDCTKKFVDVSLFRVTSLEQLSLAEFGGELERPKIYENGHKNVPGIWMDSVTKVKICKFQSF